MKKKQYRILMIISLVLLVVLVYLRSDFFLNRFNWKYRDGFYVGDYVSLKNSSENQYIVVLCLYELAIIKDKESFDFGYYIKK